MNWLIVFVVLISHHKVSLGQETSTLATSTSASPPVFSPIVTATCRAGVMTVKVETLDNFVGVVQSRDYRKPECSSYGENTRVTYLRMNMLAPTTDPDYCGVFVNDVKDEFSVAIAVRLHRTLELAGDKFYMITCGKAGFQNTRNETSVVNLELIRSGEKVHHVVYGQDYNLRAHITQPDGKFDMRVKRCFSFSNTNNTVKLVDDRGCPNPDILSEFKYNRLQGVAEAKLYSMFKFPESNRVHFQCDIVVCKGRCADVDCNQTSSTAARARALQDPQADALLASSDDGALMASYSVFVLEPGEQIDVDSVCQDCTAVNSLVYYLCLAFGILFLVMLIINVYLCCAMSSNGTLCFRKEKEVKQSKPMNGQPEEFDPYARSWHGSQYGSRYSLNGAVKPMPVPYIPADSKTSGPTLTITTTTTTDNNNFATVGARPDSRYSHKSGSKTNTKNRSRSRSKHPPVHSSSSAQSGSSTQYSRTESTGKLFSGSGSNGHAMAGNRQLN